MHVWREPSQFMRVSFHAGIMSHSAVLINSNPRTKVLRVQPVISHALQYWVTTACKHLFMFHSHPLLNRVVYLTQAICQTDWAAQKQSILVRIKAGLFLGDQARFGNNVFFPPTWNKWLIYWRTLVVLVYMRKGNSLMQETSWFLFCLALGCEFVCLCVRVCV